MYWFTGPLNWFTSSVWSIQCSNLVDNFFGGKFIALFVPERIESLWCNSFSRGIFVEWKTSTHRSPSERKGFMPPQNKCTDAGEHRILRNFDRIQQGMVFLDEQTCQLRTSHYIISMVTPLHPKCCAGLPTLVQWRWVLDHQNADLRGDFVYKLPAFSPLSSMDRSWQLHFVLLRFFASNP